MWSPLISASFLSCSSLCLSRSLDLRIRIATSLLLYCDLSFWQETMIPVGRWVILMALSVLLTCWPPAPPDLYVSILRSSVFISTSTSLNSGITSTDTKDVCLLADASNGDILTSLWTPFSDFI